MIEIAIMVEGQNGLNWPRWQRLAQTVEDLGFAGLYRSDHYTNSQPPDLDSLELWVSLTWLASHTRHIRFGPLVSPLSFRHPTHTARMASAVDDLSGGRLTLGLGAGWQEREHLHYGWDLLDISRRFARFEEGLQVIHALLHSESPVDFQGEYYSLSEATLLPRPQRPGGPPILIGGNGERLTLPLAARYADEWNAVYLTPEQFKARTQKLQELLAQAGRPVDSVRRSMMTGIVFGRTEEEVSQKVARRTQSKRSADDLRSHGVIVGTAGAVNQQLEALEQAGVQMVMLQWLDLDDLVGLTALAEAVLSR